MLKAPAAASADARARMCRLALALVTLAQGVPFIHAGGCTAQSRVGGGPKSAPQRPAASALDAAAPQTTRCASLLPPHLAPTSSPLSRPPPPGDDLLRSKSLDRDSYNSGDHFNRVDWTGGDNNFGVVRVWKERGAGQGRHSVVERQEKEGAATTASAHAGPLVLTPPHPAPTPP
jgi:hypothetical protein